MIKDLEIFNAPISGISLVEAGAGTGKTYNIASLYVRILLEKKLLPANILVLTYTDAATAELKTRLRERITESINVLEGKKSQDDFLIQLSVRFPSSSSNILRDALYKFDEAQISTIHGFCQRLLKEHSLEFGVNPDFQILANEEELIQDTVDDFWRSFIKDDSSEFKLSIQLRLLQEGYNPDKLLLDVKEVIKNSRAEFLPKPKSIKNFEVEYLKFKVLFEKTKQVFFKEAQQFIEVLNSGKLNGNIYRANTKFQHFENVSLWFNSNYTPLQIHEKLELFGNRMRDTTKKEVPFFETHDLVDKCIEALQDFDTLIPSFIVEASKSASESLKNEKEKQDLLSYDDLLEKVSEGLRDGNNALIQQLRNRLPIALIDEFQDTDPVQYSIFKSMYGKANGTALFMIGDPKQAIYSFRGADLNTYLEARKDAIPEQIYSLRKNYRSTKGMIKAVNQLFNNTTNPFIIDRLNFNEAQYPANSNAENKELFKGDNEVNALQFIEIQTDNTNKADVTKDVLDSLTSEVIELLNNDYKIGGERVAPKDIAILVRKHYQAQAIQDELSGRGIKSVIKSKQSVFKTKESDELYIIFSAILNPAFEPGIRAALSTELLGKNANDINDLLLDEQLWNTMYLTFHDMNNLWSKRGFSSMMKELLNAFEIELKLSKFFDAERRITNFYHLIELLKKTEIEENLHPHGLIKYFKDQRNSDSNPSDDEVIRLESDAQLIQIVTMHSSKGLEYPIIFCPFLYEGISNNRGRNSSKLFSFHDDGKLVLDIGSTSPLIEENKSIAFQEELEENIRLTYVALTRAKSACFIHVVAETEFESSTLTSLLIGNEKVEYKLSKELKDPIKKEVISTLNDFVKNSSFTEHRQHFVSTDLLKLNHINSDFEMSSLSFKRNDLFNFPKVVSFSGLSSSTDSEIEIIEKSGFDYDALSNKIENKDDDLPSIFTLPKGAKTGTLIHNIFEDIDFFDAQSFETAIDKQIELHGFDSKWKTTLMSMLTSSTKHILFDDFSLSYLKKEDYLVEMEFYFPVNHINGSELLKIIRNSEIKEESESMNGFMKGFIDLIFKYKDKYYILDYKSNHLGNSYEDYSQVELSKEIQHSKYDLQYHIYTIALHRYLKNRVKDYSYEQHFGGAIYLFLRGIKGDEQKSGVFFDRPKEELVVSLDDYVKKGEGNERYN